MHNEINQLISGALVMGNFVAGLFFFRFWKSTRDRLFMIFGWAFVLFGVQRLALALIPGSFEDSAPLYIIRLVGFTLILIAVIDKNRSGKKA